MLVLCIAGSYTVCAYRSGIVLAVSLALLVLCRVHSRSCFIKGVAAKGYTVTVTFFRLVLFSSSLVLFLPLFWELGHLNVSLV